MSEAIKTITELEVDGVPYRIAADQSTIANLAFYFNEKGQGIISNIIPNPENNEDDSVIPRAGLRAVAFGQGCQALARNSIAMGINSRTTSSGIGSIALGNGAQASGDGAISIGHMTNAANTGAIALGGEGSQAKGIASFAVGDNAIAKSDYSIALGRSAYAEGKYSVAVGSSLVATKNYSTVIGKRNRYFKTEPERHDNLLFAIGNGFWYKNGDSHILEDVPDELNVIPNESGDTPPPSQYKSQPGCALEVYADGRAIWNSRRQVGSAAYTTEQYIVTNQSCIDWRNELMRYINSLTTDTFNITLLYNNGSDAAIKAFGRKDNFFIQIYQQYHDVAFYHYVNNQYYRMSINNISLEGGME